MYGSRLYKKKYSSKRYAKRAPLKLYKSLGYGSQPIPRFGQSSFRKGYKIKGNIQTLKCTLNDRIIIQAGFNAYNFGSNALNYMNISTALQNCAEFTTRAAQYAYYKLNGIQVKFTRRWLDTIPIGDATHIGWDGSTIGNGLSMLSVNFFPTLSSTVVSQLVEQADSSGKISPYLTESQDYYIRFPRNFSQGPNASGLGTWNSCLAITNLSGQIAIFNDFTNVFTTEAGFISVFDVEINFYTNFCNNTGA